MGNLNPLNIFSVLTSCSTAKFPRDSSGKGSDENASKYAFTPTVPGWFVPDARMKEIMDALNDKANPHR